MNEFFLFAQHYKNLGLSVTSISNKSSETNFYSKNPMKAPSHKWKHLFAEKQTENEFQSLDWSEATGVGTVTGYNSLRVIDIDGCGDYDFLDKILQILGLPKNYEWVSITGSNNGFHIFLRCSYYYLDKNQVVTTYPPKEEFAHLFEKIEILWKTHVVLPPSLHKSGGDYKFLNCKFPKNKPEVVDYRRISRFIDTYVKAEKVVIGSTYGENVFEFIPPAILSDLDEENVTIDSNRIIYCILDTETDGLPIKKNGSIEYPNVVQIAWLLMDSSGKILKKEAELINYPNIKLTEAFSINKIDINMVKKIGGQPGDVYRKLISDIKISNCIVAHNTAFDLPILVNQFQKYQMQDVISAKKAICTMKESINFCKIPSFEGGSYNYPKLTELYNRLFNQNIHQKHNAISDVLITAKCFKELLDKEIIDG